MTKAELAEKIQERSGTTRKEALDLVDTFFEVMKQAIIDDNKLMISGFGSFESRQKADRKGRNPQTGEDMVIKARRVLTFKPSQLLKTSLNK